MKMKQLILAVLMVGCLWQATWLPSRTIWSSRRVHG